MNLLKKAIFKYFKHFSYFFQYLRYRIFVTFILNVSVGLLDGFGLVMFLPLLKLSDKETASESSDFGGLDFLVNGLEGIGISMNLNNVLVLMFVFFVLKGVARFIESYYKTIVHNYFIKSIRFQLIDGLSDMAYKAFVSQDAGRIQNTLAGEVSRVSSAYSAYFMTLQCSIMVIVYSILAFMANAQFAILVIVGGGIANGVFNILNKKTKIASSQISNEGHVYQGLLMQKVNYYKYLKATGSSYFYGERLKRSVENIESSNKAIGFYSSVLYAAKEPLIIGVVVGIIFLQTSFFGQGIGVILLSLMFFYRALSFLMNLQGFWNNFLSNSGALNNMKSFISSLDRNKELVGKEVFDKLKHELRLENVHFQYGKNEVVSGVNMTIRKNETVAFVGESGSGKTTIVNLIAGLMPVNSGTIYIDGHDTRDLDIRSWQRCIGYISQEPVIFSGSIFDNVTFWASKSSENKQRFWEAMEKASLSHFVRELENQEDTLLGNNGILISGGQKQRISIARELFKEVDILIMDEATSALDSETENQIQNNIDQLKGHYTILIVAHRLATIKHADTVVLLSKGKIRGFGKFEELNNKSREFSRMVSLQRF
ncbi:ABC transporter ATP-binding protein [Echinicola shivajiensis]|uniref:ABC transporter ATP-binding protein n=1 Tax=Echinicola shivajiensis TaxID=1035916 RepID=UPI001BFC0739|nr:ABC transporter ATP-binding protein [Echinicola shivajiensis]